MQANVRQRQTRATGFTLVELLVVIGIIGVLLSLLAPALAGARQKAAGIKCLSNMHQIGIAMLIYANDYHGLLIPLGPLEDGVNGDPGPNVDTDGSNTFKYQTLGTNVYPWLRWPAAILKETYPTDYTAIEAAPPLAEPSPGDPYGLYAGPWTSKLMVCPSDDKPGAAHSYLFNQHLVQNQQKVLTYSQNPPSGKTNGDVVVLGEKRSNKDDYYMETGDFPIDGTAPTDTHVELYRHGVKLGSNYLYKDMHAENKAPTALSRQVDPWDTTPQPTQKSSDD